MPTNHIKQFLELDPKNEAAIKGIQRIHATYVNWGNYYLRRNDIDRSERFFKRALQIKPDDNVSKNKLAEINSLNQAPSNGQNFNNRGLTPAEVNQVEQVYVGDLLIRAKLQLQNKNLTTPPNNNAYETYLKVLRFQPENAVAIAGISTIKQKLHQLGRARTASK